MSRGSRPDWWGYVKKIIESYPQLEYTSTKRQDRRRLAAINHAIAVTQRLPDGEHMLTVVNLVCWKKTHNLAGAAAVVGCSPETAQQIGRAHV